jgi:hypothetical protein
MRLEIEETGLASEGRPGQQGTPRGSPRKELSDLRAEG